MRHLLFGLVILGCAATPVTPSPAATVRTGLEIEPVSGLGLFPDELARSQALLAQVIAARDAGVLPIEVTTRAWALAAEGKNPLTGAACGMPLRSYEARQRWGSALGITGTVRGNVWCPPDAGCELSVYGKPLDDDADDRFTLVAPISLSGEPLGALSSAIAQLAPPQPSESGGVSSIFGSLGENKRIQEEDLLEVRIWPADQRDHTKVADSATGFPALTVAHALTCNVTRVQVFAEVSAAGAITRCEAAEQQESATADCVCGQLKRGVIAAWLSGKRWSVSVVIEPKDQLTADRRFVLNGSWNVRLNRVKVEGEKYARFRPKVEDPSIDAWSPGSAQLATGCFVNAFSAAGNLNSRWAVWFDGAGRPTKVVEQKGFPPLPKELAECVSRALRTAQSPCPSRAGLWAMADLNIHARDPNAPPPSLKDVLAP